jgi:hypothetical protein
MTKTDSAASLLSDINKTLYAGRAPSPAGKSQSTLVQPHFSGVNLSRSRSFSCTVRPEAPPTTKYALPTAASADSTAGGALGYEMKARMVAPAAARIATPPSPPSTAPPAGLPRRRVGEQNGSASPQGKAGTADRVDTGLSRQLSAKDPALPRSESGDSLQSGET